MPQPRRLRSFSLRTLMVLVGLAALAAWIASYYSQRAEKDHPFLAVMVPLHGGCGLAWSGRVCAD